MVKRSFVPSDPGTGLGQGGYVLFLGRLCPEKGVWTLARARECLGGKAPLETMGNGPLAGEVHRTAPRRRSPEWDGLEPKS